jgi:hypothetical protein
MGEPNAGQTSGEEGTDQEEPGGPDVVWEGGPDKKGGKPQPGGPDVVWEGGPDKKPPPSSG